MLPATSDEGPVACCFIVAYVPIFTAHTFISCNTVGVEKTVKHSVKNLSWLLALSLCIGLPALSIAGGHESLEARVSRLESARSGMGSWLDRISLGGHIEVEAEYIREKESGESRTDESDISLAEVELEIDIDFVKHVSGHIVLLWEPGETLDVEEAFIRLDGEDVMPFYLQAGKMFVPFGNYETFFITDPNTLELGETLEAAAVVGYASDLFELSFGIYNGDTKGRHLNSYAASAVYTLPEDAVAGLGLTTGVSWISNIADSEFLSDEADADLRKKVPAASAFAVVTLNDRWTLLAEYLTALNNFDAEYFGDEEDSRLKPKAWNVELGYALTDDLHLAAKYEGGDNLGGLLPKRQFGVAASYDLFKYTTLSLEYLHGTFANRDKYDIVTMQLAFEF